MSLLIVKLTGIQETRGRTDIVSAAHALVEDRFIPSKRALATAVANALFVVDDESVRIALDDVTARHEEELLIDAPSVT